MKDATSSRVRFGEFELDLKAGELHKGERKVRLQEQPFQILLMLVERAGEVVGREEIQSKLWPNDTVVEFDHGINTAIRKLRTALDDSAEKPDYIETIARRGYRFIMPVETLQSSSDGGSIPDAQVVAGGGEASPQPLPGTAELSPGKTVSHYRVLNLIGGGGMGVVYRAEDLRLGRMVALKFLPDEVASDPVALRRFEREARTASSLNHPNICTIYEVEEHEGTSFIVMEYLEGMTLRELISHANVGSPLDKSRPPTLRVDEILDMATQIAEGLDAAHQKQIIHRDIKPANIFVTRQRQVKILDFGLAKLVTTVREVASDRLTHNGRQEKPEEQEEPNPETNLTREGAYLGTTGYMSPEQVMGFKLDARTDLFCFGLILYELCTGKRAFAAPSKQAFRDAVVNDTPPPVLELNPAVPAPLEKIINCCLEKDRAQRYQHASDVSGDLKQLRSELGPPNTPRDFVAQRIAEAEKRSKAAPGTMAKAGTRPQPFRGKWIIAAVSAVMAIAAAAWYESSHRPFALHPADTIVLSDFENSTGDPVFDSSMNTAFKTEMGQTPYINVLSADKVRRTLKLMNQAAGGRLTPELARDVCLRTNSRAVLTGSIGDAGNRYHLELKAIDCRDGKGLASAERDAPNRDEIVRELGIAGNELREKLGESKASLQKFNKPLDVALTSSVEALQAYSESGKQKIKSGDVRDVFSGLNRALELDPNFAEAYLRLGIAYLNKNETDLSIQNFKRAYELRGRVTERSRYMIDFFNYIEVTGEVEKGIQSATDWAKTYPMDPVAHADLSADLMAVGQYERAVAEGQESVRLYPIAFGYVNLMSANLRLNRLDQAKAVFDEALNYHINDANLFFERYVLAFLQSDMAGMQQQVNAGKNDPESEYILLSAHSATEAYRGRLVSADAYSQQSIDSAKRAGAQQAALFAMLNHALCEAEAGDQTKARQQALAVLAASQQRDIKAAAALVLARAGDTVKAAELAQGLERAYPVDTWMQRHEIPAIKAAIELQKNDSASAIDALRIAAPYDLADLSFRSFPPVYPVYIRGEAYLRAGQGQMAAAEFQKIVDHPGIVTNFITGALSYLQLARAQVMMGKLAEARESYQHFLGLWKDADANNRILKQAKSEYAKL